MKKDIEHILNTTRPELTHSERFQVWSGVTSTFGKTGVIPSPFYVLFRAHRTAFALAFIVLVLVGGGATVVTAETARPGDTLFPLDQAIERVRIRLARTDDDRGRLADSFAKERLGELRSIVGERQTHASSSENIRDDARVGAAVSALMRVMDESNMSDTAREKIYGHLFTEIDDLKIDVRVGDTNDGSDDGAERVKVRRDESGSKIEIRKEGMRTRIEKKDGEVRIKQERGEDIEDSDVLNEDGDDNDAKIESDEDTDVERNDDDEKSEVRGAMTDSRDDEDRTGGKNRGRED